MHLCSSYPIGVARFIWCIEIGLAYWRRVRSAVTIPGYFHSKFSPIIPVSSLIGTSLHTAKIAWRGITCFPFFSLAKFYNSHMFPQKSYCIVIEKFSSMVGMFIV